MVAILAPQMGCSGRHFGTIAAMGAGKHPSSYSGSLLQICDKNELYFIMNSDS